MADPNPTHAADVTDCLTELHGSIMEAVRWTEQGEAKDALLDAIAALDRLCHELGYELSVKKAEAPHG
ncbi:MAG: hypothetical protein IPM35_02560 [Myxococcales bacterium]|nr:hypothetical protein [Myxococcales bacterium]